MKKTKANVIDVDAVLDSTDPTVSLPTKTTKAIANALTVADPEKQKAIVDRVAARSCTDLLNVASSLVSLIKQSMESSDKRSNRFSSQCDVALDALRGYVKDGNVDAEERAKARENIMELVRLSNRARSEAEKSNNKKFLAGVGAVAAAAIVAIGATLAKIIGGAKRD